MVQAAQEIRADLAQESRVRHWRALALLVVFCASVAGFAIGTGLKADLAAHDLLVLSVAAGFVLFGVVVSFSPELRFGRWSAGAIALVAVISPTFAATYLSEAEGPAWGSLGCFGVLFVLGAVLTVATRVILGRTRRRFGGASQLQGVAAALAAALAVGLHCASGGLIHLATHAAAAGLLALGLGRLLLR